MAEETNQEEKPKKNHVRTVLEAILLFITSYILVAMSDIGRTHRYRRTTPQNLCFSNQRVLNGAIEMYNMDHNEMIKTYDQSVRDLLIKDKYLRSDFMDEVECEFITEGDLTETGFIYCVNHGDLGKNKEGKDEFASLTPNRDRINERNKILLVLGLLFGPTLFYLLLRLLF